MSQQRVPTPRFSLQPQREATVYMCNKPIEPPPPPALPCPPSSLSSSYFWCLFPFNALLFLYSFFFIFYLPLYVSLLAAPVHNGSCHPPTFFEPHSSSSLTSQLMSNFLVFFLFLCLQPSPRTLPTSWLSRLAQSRWWWPSARLPMGNRLPPSSGSHQLEATTRPALQTGPMARWRCAASTGWFPRRQITAGRWAAAWTRGHRSGRGFTPSSFLSNVRETHTSQFWSWAVDWKSLLLLKGV